VATAQRITTRRRRGIQAGLTLDRIIAAARTLDPAALTIQAVANTLSVDRKAINHHVVDRGTLMALVAKDAFSSQYSALDVAAQSSWQDACRAYGHMFTNSVLAAGAFAEYLKLDDSSYMTTFLESIEIVLARLIDAGFDYERSVRLLALLTNLCLGYARDSTEAAFGARSRPTILREALSDHREREFPHLAQMSALDIDTYGPDQLKLSLGVFLSGAEQLLQRT
jgi:TetR/AcrR family transcriptional regulator, tetracycline repressor protein